MVATAAAAARAAARALKAQRVALIIGFRRSHARLAPCGMMSAECAGSGKNTGARCGGILARNGLRIGKYVAMLRVL
jgi:hypothetical protein